MLTQSQTQQCRKMSEMKTAKVQVVCVCMIGKKLTSYHYIKILGWVKIHNFMLESRKYYLFYTQQHLNVFYMQKLK